MYEWETKERGMATSYAGDYEERLWTMLDRKDTGGACCTLLA